MSSYVFPAVTPSDTVALPKPARVFYIGVSGDVAVLGVDDGFVDLDRKHFACAVGGHGHFAATGGGSDGFVGEFGLRLRQLLLHLGRLLHHFFEVHNGVVFRLVGSRL